MPSHENAPASPTKRNGPPLKRNSSYQEMDKAKASSPTTPRAQTSHSGQANIQGQNPALKVRPSQRDTFLEDITPASASKKEDLVRGHETRDSHDLSMSPQQVTRASLVDNMLLSLDSFPYGQGDGRRPTVDEEKLYSSFADEDAYNPEDFTPTDGKAAHNYSHSSDYEKGDASSSSRYSDRSSRERRSNSSSGFQPGPGPTNNMRNGSVPNSIFNRAASGPMPFKSAHLKNDMGSNGSSTQSFEHGQNSNVQRTAHGLAKRSSSFDHDERQSVHDVTMSRQQTSHGQPLDPYDYDAAPTPTVPGGPRKPWALPEAMASFSDLPSVELSPHKLERKKSAKSSKSAYKGKAKYEYGLNDQNRELPPLPAFVKDPGPKPKEPIVTPSAKEKPGFFRRVFGSGKHSAQTAAEPPPSHESSASVDLPSGKGHHIANQIKPQNEPTSPKAPRPPPKEPPTLTKKPSSFFRRRKKSVSEAESPVPRPLVLSQRPDLPADDKSQPSPVSSLREVMSPYLRDATYTQARPQTQHTLANQVSSSPIDDRHPRSFSPDYTPDKSATIRAVKPSSRDASGPKSSPTSVSKASTSKRPANNWPTSVARDIALVAEYERIHSKRSPTPAKSELSRASPALESPRTIESRAGLGRPDGDEERVVPTPSKSPEEAEKGNRVYLVPSPEEKQNKARLSLPRLDTSGSARTSTSTDTVYKSATSLPVVQVEGEEELEQPDETVQQQDEPEKSTFDLPDPTTASDSDRERAEKIFNSDEDFLLKDKAAAWLGEDGPIQSKTLVAYMELYDFANLNILAALRVLCGRLVLKAESQQVDRILEAFAQRWCQCNPNHGFKVMDAVHTICYSILLLNTDLHLADIDQKMTRSQFVKNTMPTVRRAVIEAAPDAFEPNRPTVLPGKTSVFDADSPVDQKDQKDQKALDEGLTVEAEKPSWRSSFKPPSRAGSDGLKSAPTPLDYDTPTDDCGPLVKAPFHGTQRTWEVQVEIVLKDFYNSIRNERLPLFGGLPEKSPHGPSTSSLNVFNGVRRTPSVLSKTPSEAQSFVRGRTADTVRAGNGKWVSKNRSKARLYPNSAIGSSRTSLDDQSSMWSPSASSTWSKYSLGKTHTSMSVDSLNSNWPNGDYQQSIGFANALSQAIIREETVGSIASESEELKAVPLLEDESLELHGAPWAKEGIVKYKHHLEALDKKAKDRNWNEVFAVIEKGYMSLFSFSSKTTRNKSKGKASGGVVGGGNWQENAENLGSFQLRQTIASSLPPPGYSKSRPHVWALSLPTGAVHLFQVGTPDIVKEFVSTANYWSARLSHHPLVGGISNIEYGWSENIINNALVAAINEANPVPSRPSSSAARPSMQSSLRSSIDQTYNGVKARLPGDKITISDWTPPTQNMRASNLLEPDQLKTLLAYVAGIEDELQKHNQLRSSMLLAFTPRHPNAQKAMANWEKKSSYLLREIVKFRTYIDCLHAAEAGKARIYAERAAEEEGTQEAKDDATASETATAPVET